MTRQIFDQDRPRSKMAQRLDEAFAGCEEWTVAPAPPRRKTLEVAPWVGPAKKVPMSQKTVEMHLPRAA